MVTIIDLGNTRNFIDSKLVKSMGLRVAPLQNFQLSMVSDTMMDYKGMVKGLNCN